MLVWDPGSEFTYELIKPPRFTNWSRRCGDRLNVKNDADQLIDSNKCGEFTNGELVTLKSHLVRMKLLNGIHVKFL